MSYKYEKGFVVEQPTMEKPKHISIEEFAYTDNTLREYNQRKFKEYYDHIKNLRRYPVPPEYRHVWKEGDILEEGKDFRLDACHHLPWLVAIPIEPKQEPLPPFQYGTQGAHAIHEHEQENYMEKSKEEKKYSYYPFSGIYKIVFKEPGEEEVYIASTYDAEKAHFLATAANAYKEPLADFEKADEENTKGDVWDAAINAFKEAYTFTGNLGFPTNELLKILKKKYLLVELPEPVLQDFKQMDLLNKAADLFKNMIDDGIAESDIQNMESWLNEYENGKAAPFKDALTCLNEVADSRYCIPMPFNYDMLIEAMEAYRNQYDGLQQAVQPNQ